MHLADTISVNRPPAAMFCAAAVPSSAGKPWTNKKGRKTGLNACWGWGYGPRRLSWINRQNRGCAQKSGLSWTSVIVGGGWSCGDRAENAQRILDGHSRGFLPLAFGVPNFLTMRLGSVENPGRRGLFGVQSAGWPRRGGGADRGGVFLSVVAPGRQGTVGSRLTALPSAARASAGGRGGRSGAGSMVTLAPVFPALWHCGRAAYAWPVVCPGRSASQRPRAVFPLPVF